MTALQFENIITNGSLPVLAVFINRWCYYCRRLIPIMERIAQQHRTQLLIARIDVDTEAELAQRERIEVVPTLVLYQQGRALGSLVSPNTAEAVAELLSLIKNPVEA